VTVATTFPAATAQFNGSNLDSGSSIVIQAKPVANAPAINPVLSVSISASDQGDVAFWSAKAVVEKVSTAVWGTGSAPVQGQPPELAPAITSIRLVPVIGKSDDLAPIEQEILLVSDTDDIDVQWSPSTVPAQQSFDWGTQNPYQTIHADAVKQQLSSLVAQGYLAQNDLDAIDPSFVKAGEPCFMAHPVLCRLAAEQYSEAPS
jgi:hypothetical protein